MAPAIEDDVEGPTVWSAAAVEDSLKLLTHMEEFLEEKSPPGPVSSMSSPQLGPAMPSDSDFELNGVAPGHLSDDMSPKSGELTIAQLKEALDVVRSTLRLYGPAGVLTSFNGGKDAVAVLHLMRAAYSGHYIQYDVPSERRYRPEVIFFRSDDEFPEVEQFIFEIVERYDLNLRVVSGSYVTGMKNLIPEPRQAVDEKSARVNPTCHAAILLGVRDGDPTASDQSLFMPSSAWLPPFMRANPIFRWTYGSVWDFLHRFSLPYCPLYDVGYTSLGRCSETQRNPCLRQPDGEYLPARCLLNYEMEREGRAFEESPVKTSVQPDLSLSDESRTRFHSFCVEECRRMAAWREDVAHAKTAGLIIVGDEILKGQRKDLNSEAAIQCLRDVGIELIRIATVRDVESAIVGELRRQIAQCDVVITSGGLGPTHDDVTIKCVARALGQKIAMHPQMAEQLKDNFHVESLAQLTAAQKRFAYLPEMVRLRTGMKGETFKGWPILQCENVFLLPGVPEFFEEKLRVICCDLLSSRHALGCGIAIEADEAEIVEQLDCLAEEFKGDVGIGSYPTRWTITSGEMFTMVLLESVQEPRLLEAIERTKELVGEKRVKCTTAMSAPCGRTILTDRQGKVRSRRRRLLLDALEEEIAALVEGGEGEATIPLADSEPLLHQRSSL